MGHLKYFLGFEISRSSKGINIYQRKYNLDLVQHVGLLAAKPSSTLMEPCQKHDIENDEPLTNPTQFISLIGKLLHLKHLRPDISYYSWRLNQYMSKSSTTHMPTTMWILKHVKNAPTLVLFFAVILEWYWQDCLIRIMAHVPPQGNLQQVLYSSWAPISLAGTARSNTSFHAHLQRLKIEH